MNLNVTCVPLNSSYVLFYFNVMFDFFVASRLAELYKLCLWLLISVSFVA